MSDDESSELSFRVKSISSAGSQEIQHNPDDSCSGEPAVPRKQNLETSINKSKQSQKSDCSNNFRKSIKPNIFQYPSNNSKPQTVPYRDVQARPIEKSHKIIAPTQQPIRKQKINIQNNQNPKNNKRTVTIPEPSQAYSSLNERYQRLKTEVAQSNQSQYSSKASIDQEAHSQSGSRQQFRKAEPVIYQQQRIYQPPTYANNASINPAFPINYGRIPERNQYANGFLNPFVANSPRIQQHHQFLNKTSQVSMRSPFARSQPGLNPNMVYSATNIDYNLYPSYGYQQQNIYENQVLYDPRMYYHNGSIPQILNSGSAHKVGRQDISPRMAADRSQRGLHRLQDLETQIDHLNKQVQLREEEIELAKQRNIIEQEKLLRRIEDLEYKNSALQQFAERYNSLEQKYQEALSQTSMQTNDPAEQYPYAKQKKMRTQELDQMRELGSYRSEVTSKGINSVRSKAEDMLAIAQQQKAEYEQVIFELHSENKLLRTILEQENLLQKPKHQESTEKLRQLMANLRGINTGRNSRRDS